MADAPYWESKVHEAVKFRDLFERHTVEGGMMVTQCATKCCWVKSELEALRAEERSWSFWGAIYNRLRTQHDPTSKRRRVLLSVTPLQDHDERHPNDG